MDNRAIRGYAIISKGDEPQLIDEETFLIPSQSSDKKYKVMSKNEWSCECEDYLKRKLLCKHIHAIKFWLKMKEKINAGMDEEIIEDVLNDIKCINCNSLSVVKNGNRNTTLGIRQRYLCRDCKKRFVIEPITHIKGNSKIVTLTMDLYFKGLSLRDISDTIKQFYGLELHHETIRRWIMRFTEMANDYTKKLQPKLSDKWHTDEQMIKVKGKWLWNWNVLDSDTRFLIASNVTKGREIKDARKVFQKAKEIAETNPNIVITDGLHSYQKAIKKEFLPRRTKLEHKKYPSIRDIHVNNNKVERFHNTFREFDKVRRGYKSENTAQGITDGFRTYYNFIRPHMGISNLTPSKMAGIDLDLGSNRWLGLIKKSKESNGISEKKKFELNFRNGKTFLYSLKVIGEDGNELNCKELGFKEKYFDKETVNKFIEFYKTLYPKYEFRIITLD